MYLPSAHLGCAHCAVREQGNLRAAPRYPGVDRASGQRVEKEGIDAWFDLDPAELLGDDADQYSKVTDTLDVWFDSGVTHYCVLDQREQLRSSRRICTWRALTSTVAGSSRHC